MIYLVIIMSDNILMSNSQDIINSKKNIYTVKITKKNINDDLYNITNYDDILPEYFIIITPTNNNIYKFIFKLKINKFQYLIIFLVYHLEKLYIYQ